MTAHPLAVAVLGGGPVAERLAALIERAPDLVCTVLAPPDTELPEGTDCVVYAPRADDDLPKTLLPQLLRGGVDVVTTLPAADTLPLDEIREACRSGVTAFHASGGFQSAIVARVARSLAEVSRGIRRVELVEELELPSRAVFPWTALADTGIGTTDPDRASAAVAAVHDYYEAGLRVLDQAAFQGTAATGQTVSVAIRVGTDDAGVVDRITVDRDLGPRLGYRSVWTRHTGNPEPLRYQLLTTTDEAAGAATVRFRFDGDLHPAEHLTCLDVLNAVRALPAATGPGILHRDLAITHLVPDRRLA